MKKLYYAVLFAGLFVPGISRAQDPFTPAGFEKILTEDLKKDFFKKQLKTSIEYDIKDTPYFAYFSTSGNYLLFVARLNAAGIELKKVNDWNQGAIFSRAYIMGNTLIFEVPLSFAAGVTKEIVKHYYNKFEEEFGNFKLFIEKK